MHSVSWTGYRNEWVGFQVTSREGFFGGGGRPSKIATISFTISFICRQTQDGTCEVVHLGHVPQIQASAVFHRDGAEMSGDEWERSDVTSPSLS